MTSRSNTRVRIVRAATGLFRRRGVSGTGISEICERAHVTKGVFSYHFPGGKAELVAAVVHHNGEEVRAALTDLRETGEPLSRRLLVAFAAYATLMEARGATFGCPVAASVVDAAGGSPQVRAAARDAFRGWAEELTDGDPDLGLCLVAALEGGILLARAEEDPSVLPRVGRALAALVASVEQEGSR